MTANADGLRAEDSMVFGEETYVYCSSHLRAHVTGWCTVGVDNKVGLGIKRDEKDADHMAAEKCRRLGLRLYQEGEPMDMIARSRTR